MAERQLLALQQLPELIRRVTELERQRVQNTVASATPTLDVPGNPSL